MTLMMLVMVAILVLTVIVAVDAHDNGGNWIFWALLGFAEGLMTYFVFR